MQTEAFAEGLQRLVDLSARQRVAIMCAEAVPWRRHALTPFARVGGARLTDPPAPEA
jgi:hypothetical protein